MPEAFRRTFSLIMLFLPAAGDSTGIAMFFVDVTEDSGERRVHHFTPPPGKTGLRQAKP
jgi:hypothetical protein